MPEMPPDLGPDSDDDTPAVPIEDLLGLEPLTGDAALRTDPPPPAAPPLPEQEPEAPQKAAKPRRGRRASKSTDDALKEALDRLDEASR